MIHQLQWLQATLRTTTVNLHWNLPMLFIHGHRLMNNWLKESCLFSCFVLVPNDIPTRGSGRGNYIMPFVGNWLLKNLLSSNPLPSKLGRVHQEGSHLRQPPPAKSKKSWSRIPKNKVNLGSSIALWQSIHPNMWPPPCESCGWVCIPCIRVHLSKSKFLWPNDGFREGIHEFRTELNQPKFKFLKLTCTSQLDNSSSWFYYKPIHHRGSVDWAPCWLISRSHNGP
jgi:hypothetical protein